MKHSTINFFGQFSNVRLERRCNSLLDSLVEKESASIHGISKDWNGAIGNYRMLDNDAVELDAIKDGIIEDCIRNCECSHVLMIQDTSQPNYQAHSKRIKPESGLGLIGDNRSLGYFLHPTLALDAESQHVLGFTDIKTWVRSADRQVKKDGQRQKEPIEEKESYRWLESIENSKRILSKCEMVTSIADREGDIFELFASVADEKTHLLIRSRDNRRIVEGKLYEYLSGQPATGRYELKINGDIRKTRKERIAIIEVKTAKVGLLKPVKLNKMKDIAGQVEMYAIEAKEIQETVPAGEKPVLWRLLTTHKIHSFKQAVMAIYWYSLRWNIEQLFRLLQNEGLNIESSELEKGTSIIKLGVLALAASLKIMQLLLAFKNKNDQPAKHIFTEYEIECLMDVSTKYEGKTDKLKNKNKHGTLKWASWIIARIGGWKGYESQRQPGPITFFNGLHDFYIMFEGWALAKKIPI